MVSLTKLEKLEQETMVIWNEEEPEATVYTVSPLVKVRLEKVGLRPVREQGEGRWYKVPREALRMKLDNKTVKLANKKKEKK